MPDHSYIHAIGTANPAHRLPQKDIATFMSQALAMDEREDRLLRALYRASGIQHRHTVIKDYGADPSEFSFFPASQDLEPFPRVAQRMALYRREALPLAKSAVADMQAKIPQQDLKECTHIIVASCTGMYAPGLDIELIDALGLSTATERTGVNFMGCYAAVTALRLADHICRASENARVLVVCLELCTIHFQKIKDDDNLLANSLFADGAAAVWLSPKAPSKGKALRVGGFRSELIRSASEEMAWQIGDHGFEMRLSSYVPEAIRQGIAELSKQALDHFRVDQSEIISFANHPGGKKILQVIESELDFDKEMHRHSYQVLRDYGNMSSATLLFVLASLFSESENTGDTGPVMSFAFGPGLTLESMLLYLQ